MQPDEEDVAYPHYCEFCGWECDCDLDEEGNCQFCSECNNETEADFDYA